MKKSKSYSIVVSGLMVTLGLILPYFTSHMFGVPGTVLLPMHIPVLLCGLLCGAKYGALAGLLIPVLSSVFTGMPPVFPMLPVMAVQLTVMGFVVGLVHQTLKKHSVLALVVAIVAGNVTYGLVFSSLMLATGTNVAILSVFVSLLKGLPGMAIQLIFLPLIVSAVNRYTNTPADNTEEKDTDSVFETAKEMIKTKKATCVLIKNGEIIHTASGKGVAPLIRLYEDEPEKLKDSFVVDKIIGKAAAMLTLLGGAKKVYGEIMSESGFAFLQENNMEALNGRCVDMISNRQKNGICPIERSVLEISDPNEGLTKIKETIAVLMQQTG